MEYTYLKLPRSSDFRSCIAVVLAGLTARAGIGVGGLEEAMDALERSHAAGGTSYRFAHLDGMIRAQVEDENVDEPLDSSRWRTLAELAS